MDYEDAQKKLAAIKNKTTRKAWIASVEAMPKTLRRTCRLLNDQDPKTGKEKKRLYYHYGLGEKEQLELAKNLDGLSVEQRVKVFGLFTGALGSMVEDVWQWMKQRPYTVGWQRKAFRAPNDPELSGQARVEWLTGFLEVCKEVVLTPENLIEMAPALSYQSGYLSNLLASQIAQQNDYGKHAEQTLIDIVLDDSSGAQMGSYVIGALLRADQEAGWVAVEKLLLAAQRQEGLRQSIIEEVDLAHPQAFLRMIRLVLEENLLRFSSIARGVDVWFAQEWDAKSYRAFRDILKRSLSYLEDRNEAINALGGKDPEAAYFSLWSLAFYDVMEALPWAENLLSHQDPAMRFAAAYFLSQSSCDRGRVIARAGLRDEHPTVIEQSLWAVGDDEGEGEGEDLVDLLRSVLDRFPGKTVSTPELIWPWTEGKMELSHVADLLIENSGKRSVLEIVEDQGRMSPHGRYRLVGALASECKGKNRSAHYKMLLSFAKDRSPDVVNEVFKHLEKLKVDEEASEVIESLLTRKAANFRRSALQLLLGQPDAACLSAAGRLLESKNAAQRAAGLEMVLQLVSGGRAKQKAIVLAESFEASRKSLTKDEESLLALVLEENKEKHSLANVLGLIDPSEVELAKPPESGEIVRHTPEVDALLASFQSWFNEHAEREVEVRNRWSDTTETSLLGSLNYVARYDEDKTREENLSYLPIGEEMMAWFEETRSKLKDPDGLLLIRSDLYVQQLNDKAGYYWDKNRKLPTINGIKMTHLHLISGLIHWVGESETPGEKQVDLLLAYASAAAAEYCEKNLTPGGYRKKAQELYECESWAWLKCIGGVTLNDAQFESYFNLRRWLWRPSIEHKGRVVPIDRIASHDALELETVLPALERGLMDDTEALFLLGGVAEGSAEGEPNLQAFVRLTGRKPIKELAEHPAYARLVGLAETFKQRAIDVELERGDLKQVTSSICTKIDYVGGAQRFVQFAGALGKDNLVRQYQWGEDGYARNSVFSSLLRVSEPLEDDTPEEFSALAKACGLPKERWIDIAMFAPQWAGLIEAYLNIPGIEDAVWWVHAHTKDEHWEVSNEVRELWKTELAAKTPLSSEDLVDGAVDVAWFQRVYGVLKKAKWQQIMKSAKFASSSGGHKRAELFARAMSKQVTKTELTKRIKDKRHQDSVRALGLLPLAGGQSREKDLLSRYELLQEFVRQSKQFGSQRQASEKRCAQIGKANLARTAGYADPVRLEWAMEAKAVEDLKGGSTTLEVEDVCLTLSIDTFGEPELSVQRGDKALKAIPAKLKKVPAVTTFSGRKTTIKKQLSRMRASLEEMMNTGEAFTGAELQTLVTNPLMNHFLSQLVFRCEGARGYLAKDAQALEDPAGKLEPIAAKDEVFIVHPYEWLESGDWTVWQQHCFASERVQPFKQVFREVYPVSAAERSDVNHRSARYAGHQVNPRQALALLGSRGWLTIPEEGVRKVFHKEELCAWLDFEEYFYTPGELEGLTLASVWFFKKDGSAIVPLAEVPPHIFSECMRDVDLVASVAHVGGVDPEASQSTVEMRRSLAEETCRLLGIKNVAFEKTHMLIEGTLAKYSVHLGSAIVHTVPGHALFIVSVQSQHRGRIFLPFADSDPKTAEVLSKMILLARDEQIKDPKILEQLRR